MITISCDDVGPAKKQPFVLGDSSENGDDFYNFDFLTSKIYANFLT